MNLSTEKTLRAIRYAKQTADPRYSGEQFESGYQTITVAGKTLRGQRNTRERLSCVDFNFSNKSVLDIGCNIGGMLHELAGTIRYGVGIDAGTKCINAANLVAAVNKTSHLHFFVFDVEKENIHDLWSFIPEDRVDVCFFLAMGHWVANWKDVIGFCSVISDNLLFETNAFPEDLKQSMIEHIKRLYTRVRLLRSTSDDDPITQGRSMFWCSNASFQFDDALAELARVQGMAAATPGIEPLDSTGCQRKAYRIHGKDKDYFLGVGGQKNWADYAASKFLRKKEIPVVDTLVSSEDRNGTPYIIREYVKSTTLAKYESKQRIMKDVLHKLCAIHDIKASGYGFIGKPSPDGHLSGTSNTWIEFLEFLVTNEGEFLRNEGIISDAERAKMIDNYRLYFAKFREFLDAPGRFLPGDIGWSNILVDGDGNFFFTDFEFALIGDPAFDFSCMWDYSGKPLAHYLKEQERRDVSFDAGAFKNRMKLYEPIRMLFVASYASARNGRNATARFQFDDGIDKLNALVHGPLLSSMWKLASIIRRRGIAKLQSLAAGRKRP